MLYNTALGQVTIGEHFRPSWIAQLVGRYKVNDKWAVLGGGAYDSNVQPMAYRTPGLATSNFITGILGTEYNITPSLLGKFIFAHSVAKPAINNVNSTGILTKGRFSVHGNMLDLSLVWQMA